MAPELIATEQSVIGKIVRTDKGSPMVAFCVVNQARGKERIAQDLIDKTSLSSQEVESSPKMLISTRLSRTTPRINLTQTNGLVN